MLDIDRITNWFLKAKHYQLFNLFYTIPFVLQLISIFSLVLYNGNVVFGLLMAVSIVFYGGVLLVWLYSVGIGLQRLLHDDIKTPTQWFKWSLVVPTLFFLYILVRIILNCLKTSDSTSSMLNIGIDFTTYWIVIPYLVVASLFYVMSFVAKTIRAVELQAKPRLGESSNHFYLLWLYPIGIWFLQPKINALVMQNDETMDNKD